MVEPVAQHSAVGSQFYRGGIPMKVERKKIIFYCIPKHYIVSQQLSNSALGIDGNKHKKKLSREPELFIVLLARKCQCLAGAETKIA